MRYFPLLLMFLPFVLSSCLGNQVKTDRKIIKKYVEEHQLDAVESESGLWYVISKEGQGASPTLSDQVTVFYKGYLTDGTVFDETGQTPATFPLNAVIEGWQEGLQYFKEGGEGILLIPSALGYGPRRVGSIPPNSVIIFEIELVKVN